MKMLIIDIQPSMSSKFSSVWLKQSFNFLSICFQNDAYVHISGIRPLIIYRIKAKCENPQKHLNK